jgi:hypothetical protein
VDSIGAAGQSHVQTIVDHNARRGSLSDLDDFLDQVDELCRLEAEFPDLNQIDAGAHRVTSHVGETAASGLEAGVSPEQPAPVGDETDCRAVKAHGGDRAL